MLKKYIYSNKFNHVYLYGKIDSNTVLQVSSEINELNKTKSVNHDVHLKPKGIILHINSRGGSLFSGIALMNVIDSSRVPIIAYVEGVAASAATLILVAAKHRVIAPESTVLIHQLSSGVYGKYEETEFHSKINEKLMKIIYKFYTSNTKIPVGKIKEILKRDIFFSAKECIKYGIVDTILTPTTNKTLDSYFTKNPEYNLPAHSIIKKTNFNNLYFYGGEKGECLKKEEEYDNRKTIGLQYILSFDSQNSHDNSGLLTDSGKPKPIIIRINESSPLEKLTDILPLINTILMSKIPIFSFINTLVSEKTLLYSILCYKRYIYKYAAITIDFTELFDVSNKHEDSIKNTKLIRKIITDLLKKHTKIPKSILTNIFKERFYISAEDSVGYGICDQVI